MTCIVALKDDKKIYLAGDSLVSGALVSYSIEEPKVERIDNILIGASGTLRFANIVYNEFIPPKKSLDLTKEQNLLRIIQGIYDLLDKHKALEEKNGQKVLPQGSEMIIGFCDSIYKIESDFGFSQNRDLDFITCGSGMYYADASLYSTQGLHLDPKERIKKAISCASQFVVSVNDDIDIVEMDINFN